MYIHDAINYYLFIYICLLLLLCVCMCVHVCGCMCGGMCVWGMCFYIAPLYLCALGDRVG